MLGLGGNSLKQRYIKFPKTNLVEKESKYKDTDTIFENPESDEYHFRISTFSFDYWANFIAKELINNVSMGKYNVAN